MEKQVSTKKSSIKGKVLIIFLLTGILSITIISLLAIIISSTALKAQTFNQLKAVMELKSLEIQDYLTELSSDMGVIHETDEVKNGMRLLIRYHNEMGLSGETAFPLTGEGEGLTSGYQDIEKEINAKLEKFIVNYGYEDIYFICHNHGHVMYSLSRGKDRGINLGHEEYRQTSLAEIWRSSRGLEKSILSDMKPYSLMGNNPYMFIAESVWDGAIPLGIIVFRLGLDHIDSIMQERTGMGVTGETYLVGPDKLMRSNSFGDKSGAHSVYRSLNGTVAKNGVDTEAVRLALEGENGTKVIIDYNQTRVLSSWKVFSLNNDLKWIILAEIDESEIDIPVNRMIFLIALSAIVIVLFIITISLLFSRSLSLPIKTIAEGARRFSRGDIVLADMDWDLIRRINSRTDELGDTGKAFSALIEYMQEKVEVAQEISAGNLDITVKVAGTTDKLGSAFHQTISSLNELLARIKEAVTQVSSGAAQIAQSSQSLSQGASEQASSLEEISAGVNEVAGQSDRNADNALQASVLSKQSAGNATEGNRKMLELVHAMRRINESSEGIRKVVKVIDDIAFQINLLALNANVEAARAGRYGKGFAVVANEVRNLAVKSAESVKETTAMVDEAIKNIELGNMAAGDTASQLKDIVASSVRVAELLDEIAAASKEQSVGLGQMSSGLDQIERVTQSNTSNAEESAASSEELSSQARQLELLTSRFRLARRNRSSEAKEALQMITPEKIKELVMAQLAREQQKPKMQIIPPVSEKTDIKQKSFEKGRKVTDEAREKTVVESPPVAEIRTRDKNFQISNLEDDNFGEF